MDFIALGLWLGLERTDLDSGPVSHDLAGDHGTVHTLGRSRLDRGHQRCPPHGRLSVTVAAIGDLPAGDHRRSAVAVVKARGTTARCDADDVASRASALPRLRQPMARLLATWATARPWALPAGTGDVLTGLFAMTAAIAVATGTAEGRKAAILWNIFGFADLAVAITLGMIISPGPFQLIVLNGSSIGLDGFPNVLTPAFVVPGSILLHVLSLRQLRRRSRTEALGR